MSKNVYPLFEPRQVFARHPAMAWARFLEGNPEPSGVAPASPVTPPAAPASAPPEPKEPPKVPEVDVAALQAKLAAFEAAEATRAQEAQAKADAELSDLQKAQRDLAALTLDKARADALVTHPVPEKYRSLVQGTDAASFLASAKLASELAAAAEGKTPPATPLQPVPGAGTTPPEGTGPTVGSISEIRQRIAARKNK